MKVLFKKKWVVLIILVLGLGVFIWQRQHKQALEEDGGVVRQVVTSEEQILKLTPQLVRLSRGLANMQLPAPKDRRELFADTVVVSDLGFENGAGKQSQSEQLAWSSMMPVTDQTKMEQSENFSLWRGFLEQISYFEHTSFRFIRARFVGDGYSSFEGLISFSGLARKKNGQWMSLSGKQDVQWSRTESGNWKITAWKTKEMQATVAENLFFKDVLDDALPNMRDRFHARMSIHENAAVQYYQSKKTRAPSHDFAPDAMNQKPAVSVVDVDGDGFDDIYIMVRQGKNLLLRNSGDGTFVESAAELGLAVAGNTTSSIFADFDNDGDKDLFLGRAVDHCAYFENQGGSFVEIKQTTRLPALAVSLSAADYNGDGLLDVYVSTYRPRPHGTFDKDLGLNSGGTGKAWPERFLSAEDAAEFRKRLKYSKSGAVPHLGALDNTGPPNVLLANMGAGKFQDAPESSSISVWKNSFQGSWSDYDNDGDPDLYVANDWAPDHLFRNDGSKGFVDVTQPSGANTYGFAMGVSWGDYDNDGRQDLYVTNMYSKAGRRIIEQVGELGDEFKHAANGNYLYHQGENGQFKHVSGLERPALLVAKAGWSWGGQFVDLDNDTNLDIYALSGHHTAPPEVASEVDL